MPFLLWSQNTVHSDQQTLHVDPILFLILACPAKSKLRIYA